MTTGSDEPERRAPARELRLVLCIALASALTWAVCGALGLGGGTPYGVVIAALMVRPRFDHWPAPVFVLLPLIVLLAFTVAITLIVSAITVYARDLRSGLPLILQLGMFSPGVLYRVPASARSW